MPFKHACFISYAHGKHDLVKSFINQLVKALNAYLDCYFDDCVYIDIERLKPGDLLEKELPRAICGSACMIVVYFPRYDQHTFCLREYYWMEILEKQRWKLLGKEDGQGMIIPIILRGKKEDLPAQISNHRLFCDFSKFTTATEDITKNPEYVSKINEIAEYIHTLGQTFDEVDPSSVCSSFAFPGEKDVKPWRGSARNCAPIFPFRGGQ